jgi:Spy/CpxP family protein refolding chaperone
MIRKLSLSLVFASSFALAACSGSQAAEPSTQQSAAAMTRAPVAVNAHGFVKMLGEALGDVPLRAEQRAEIEKLAAEADARHESVRKAHVAVSQELASQIEKGSLDRAAVQAKIDAAVAEMDKSRPADRAAFQRLHDLLDPSQRAAFVDALKAKTHAMHHERGGFKAMHAWAEDLKLSDAQKDQIKEKMKAELEKNREGHEGFAKLREHHEHAAKMLEAFKGDSFKIDEVAPPANLEARAKDMSDRTLRMVEIALPILTAEQRTIAAQKIRERGDLLVAPPPLLAPPHAR